MKTSCVPRPVGGKKTKRTLKEIYRRLLRHFGTQRWWPGDTPFEVIVGAILTQNTNWGNVEKALGNIKKRDLLSPQALHKISNPALARLIKPAGYFNVKARRLKSFMNFFFKEYGGDIRRMRKETLAVLRGKLLSVNGIGPETADSILLYALGKPVFVVDAYTKRFLHRHNLIGKADEYHQVQDLFMSGFDHDVEMFNEYHALIVALGKHLCRPKPLCDECVLNDLCYSLSRRCGHCYRSFQKGEKITRRSGKTLCGDCRRALYV